MLMFNIKSCHLAFTTKHLHIYTKVKIHDDSVIFCKISKIASLFYLQLIINVVSAG